MPQIRDRLTIEGFAGIKHLDLEVRPFTTLIGPQSVGKSIVAKLIFLFRNVIYSLYASASNDTKLSAEKTLLRSFDEALPSASHSGGAARITFSSSSLNFIIQHSGKKSSSWEAIMPSVLRDAFNELIRGLQQPEADEDEAASGRERVEEAYLDTTRPWRSQPALQPRFIPAGRAFLSQIERDAASYFRTASIDPFMSNFWQWLNRLKSGQPSGRKQKGSTHAAAVIMKELLSGDYTREGIRDFIYSLDGRKLPPRLWSSGQQEIQPLALMLVRYCEGRFLPTSLFIEEPEAHLFPSSQRLITELIALAYNTRQPGMQMFLTTHSPYILTTINNLLLAGQLYKRRLSVGKKSSLDKVVGVDRALVPSQIGAFYMDRSECRSIIDPETNLIGSNEIDAVSSELTVQFDALLEFDRA